MEYTPIQRLGLKISKLSPVCVGLPRKTELLKYITSPENKDTFEDENTFLYKLFSIYLDNFILPPVHVTTLLLSTHFRLHMNEAQTEKQRKFVLDAYPIEDIKERFDVDYVKTMQENIEKILSVRKKDSKGRMVDNIVNRLCDCVYNSGEVAWFDPFMPPQNISVRWENSGHTVNSFNSTLGLCQAAKKVFKNVEYTTYRR